MAVKNRAAYGSVPSMTTIAFETMEDAVWPGNAPRAGRPSNPEHDALAKRLTDGAVLRLTPEGLDEAGLDKFRKATAGAMRKRGVKTESRVMDGAIYIRMKAPLAVDDND